MNRYNKGFPEDKKFKLTFRLSAKKMNTFLGVNFFCGKMLGYSNAATCCRRSHLSDSENPAVGLPPAGNGCIPFSSIFTMQMNFLARDSDEEIIKMREV